MSADNRVHGFRETPQADATRKPEDFDPGGEVRHGEADWRRRGPLANGGTGIAQGLYGNYGPRAFHNGRAAVSVLTAVGRRQNIGTMRVCGRTSANG